MIIITLASAIEADPASDPMGRDTIGWYPRMPPDEIYRSNRGVWRFGSRADREQHALFVAQGLVRGALEITGFEDFGERRAMKGRMLGVGDPVFDAYVGGPDPSEGRSRNPIYYWTPDSTGLCSCGCGQTTNGDFAPGHDQRAIHDRIKGNFGSVKEFIQWFDDQDLAGS